MDSYANNNFIPEIATDNAILLNSQPENTKDEIKIKKISIFTKMTNSVSKRPKFHLALIIILVLIIIIILIYYRGLLYIGPFYKNNMKVKETPDDPATSTLISSINGTK